MIQFTPRTLSQQSLVMTDEGEKDTILVAGDYPNELASLVIKLQSEKFTVCPIANRTTVLTLARSQVSSAKNKIPDFGQSLK